MCDEMMTISSHFRLVSRVSHVDVRSSLFNLMTNQKAAAENYPFCTIDPSTAKCPVTNGGYCCTTALL